MVLIQINNPFLQRIGDFHSQEKVTLNIDNVEIVLQKAFAVAYSQKIHRDYVLDRRISKITIHTGIQSKHTYDVLKYILQDRKPEIECNLVVLNDLFNVGIALEMSELISLYQMYVINEMCLDRNNCIKLLEFYYDINSEQKTLECTDFISSHFFEIDETQLKSISKKLGFNIFERIFCNNKLTINDEDSLASFIISLTKECEEFAQLIENIHLEFCSEQIINEIRDITNSINYMSIVNSLYDSLLRTRNINQKNSRCFESQINETVILSKISELKNSEDFNIVYKFLDNLSTLGKQNLMSEACKEGLWEMKNDSGNNILLKAAKKGNLRLVKSLIECGCNIETKNNDGFTPLILASREGKLDVVKYLLDAGADKNAKTIYENTSLIWAISRGQLEVVKHLLFIGYDLEEKNNYGNTPLIVASMCGNLEVVECLISAGSDKEAKNNYGNTVLMMACKFGRLETVHYLISIKCDKEAKNDDGNTALFLASEEGQLEVVKYLISVGADTKAKNNDGNTPDSVAKENVKDYLMQIKT